MTDKRSTFEQNTRHIRRLAGVGCLALPFALATATGCAADNPAEDAAEPPELNESAVTATCSITGTNVSMTYARLVATSQAGVYGSLNVRFLVGTEAQKTTLTKPQTVTVELLKSDGSVISKTLLSILQTKVFNIVPPGGIAISSVAKVRMSASAACGDPQIVSLPSSCRVIRDDLRAATNNTVAYPVTGMWSIDPDTDTRLIKTYSVDCNAADFDLPGRQVAALATTPGPKMDKNLAGYTHYRVATSGRSMPQDRSQPTGCRPTGIFDTKGNRITNVEYFIETTAEGYDVCNDADTEYWVKDPADGSVPARLLFDDGGDKIAPKILDKYWKNVSLLMQMDGADKGTSFIDSKFGLAITPDHVTTTAGDKKFGSASALFDWSSGSSGLQLAAPPGDERFKLDGDFTVEWWFKYTAKVSNNINISTGLTAKNGERALVFSYTNVGTINNGMFLASGFQQYNNAFVTPQESRLYAAAPNIWHHVAISRTDAPYSVTRFYLDGVFAAYSATFNPVVDLSNLVLSGSGGDGSLMMDDFRITKGVGRYPESMVIPTVSGGG